VYRAAVDEDTWVLGGDSPRGVPGAHWRHRASGHQRVCRQL